MFSQKRPRSNSSPDTSHDLTNLTNLTNDEIKQIMIDEYAKSITYDDIREYLEERCPNDYHEEIHKRSKVVKVPYYTKLYNILGFIHPLMSDRDVVEIIVDQYTEKLIPSSLTSEQINEFRDKHRPNIDWNDLVQVKDLMWKEYTIQLINDGFFCRRCGFCPGNQCTCSKKEYIDEITMNDIIEYAAYWLPKFP